MQRVLVERIPVGDLHHLAEIKHHYPVADVPHDGEIVRDEDQRQTHLGLQIHQQIDDLRLDRDIEGRDRLVADNQLRLVDDRPRDADALALPAGEFMRIAVDLVGQEPHLGHHRLHPLLHLGLLEVGAEGDQRLGDDLTHGHARVQGSQRVLEDDLHLAPQIAHAAIVELGKILAQPDRAPATQGEQAQNGAAEGRFAAAGFTDQP